MDSQTQTYEPMTVPHPGEVIAEYLEFNEWSQSDLARRTGLTPKTVSEICNGKAPISAPTSLVLERVFQRPAHFWLSLQRQYDEARERSRVASTLEEWKGWVKTFPVKEMEKLGWLTDFGGGGVEGLLSFFAVSSPSSWGTVWQSRNVAYRQTLKFKTSEPAVSAWVRAAELIAAELETEVELREFDAARLKALVPDVRRETRNGPEAFDRVSKLCATAGVLVVWVPELKQTGISGCARWLSDKKAMIALTLRYKTDDQMWFTFFHELGHILLHGKKRDFILDNAASDLLDGVVDPQMQREEEEANRFAADTLIPPDALFRLIEGGDVSDGVIKRFAEEIGVGPGIVVGRLQREKILKYNQGNDLKQTFQWNVAEE